MQNALAVDFFPVSRDRVFLAVAALLAAAVIFRDSWAIVVVVPLFLLVVVLAIVSEAIRDARDPES